MYVSKTDIILFYIFTGVILGLFLHFSFHYMRAISIPIIINASQYVLSPETGISAFFSIFFNLFHAAISAFIPSLIAALIIIKAQIKNKLIYCLVPSITIFLINLNVIITDFELSVLSEPPYYITQVFNPFIIIAVFYSVFWLLLKIKKPNKAFKPTPESGAV